MASTDNTTIDSETVTALMEDLSADLAAAGIAPDGDLAVARYIRLFDAIDGPAAYDMTPPGAHEMIGVIEAKGGEERVDAYHRLVLLTLISEVETRAAACRLPGWLRDRTLAALAGVVKRLSKPKPGQFRLDKDAFLKDLATCRLKLWPCGAESVDISSGVPRRVLLQSGPGQAFRALRHIGLGCGGFRPFFETHFDQHMAREFSPEGYQALYGRIARLLEAAPEIRGVFSGSWWHDPALAAISPNLAFLNDIPLSGGARLYRLGADDQTVAQATRLSKERTRLVREGAYRPAVYLMVWGRVDLLRWAEAESPVWRDEAIRRPQP